MSTGEAWLIAIVGGALAAILGAGVLAIFSRGVRVKLWTPILRAMRWPLSLRVTTTRKRAAQQNEVDELKGELGRAIDVAVKARRDGEAAEYKARQEGEAHVAAVKALAQDEAVARHRDYQQMIDTAREFGRVQGRAEAESEVDAQRTVRLPQPVWRIDDSADALTFTLRNTQPGVVVSDISLQAPLGDFVFNGPSQWPGPSDGVVQFAGERQRNGRSFGVKFVVRWHDVNGDPRMGEAFIDKEPRRAIVL